jgi:RNA polymerase sigma-70 factor (ECF subfamily)
MPGGDAVRPCISKNGEVTLAGPKETMTSSATLARVHPGRDAALEAARPGLERLARRLVWDEEEARDLVQSALLDGLTRWSALQDPAAAQGWLRRIVVNRAMSYLRRRRLWRVLGVLLRVDEEPVAESLEDDVARRAHLKALGAAMVELPARQATAFSLRYLEGLELDEVAEAMDLERGTVRVHVQRAVKALRLKGVLP